MPEREIDRRQFLRLAGLALFSFTQTGRILAGLTPNPDDPHPDSKAKAPRATQTPDPTQTPEAKPSYNKDGIDFADSSQPVQIKIELTDKNFTVTSTPVVCENKESYKKEFQPGSANACVYLVQDPRYPENMYIFAHSGWHKGNRLEMERVRHWLEDSGGYNPDGTPHLLPLAQIKENMAKFIGARVEINQGENTATNLKVLNFIRVPPYKLDAFDPETGSNEEILPTLGKLDPSFNQIAGNGKPKIIVIFCGWRTEEEANMNPNPIAGTYSWSRYAMVIGE